MPTARPDTATIASGGELWAGRDAPYPLVQISGSIWTPNVDGSGNILTTDYQQLPAGIWYYVGTNQIDDVVPTPRLRRKLTGADGSAGIINAWCTAAYDYITDTLRFMGGGHADSNIAENGAYGLSAATMRFTMDVPRSADESVMMRYENPPGGQAGLQPIATYSDARNDSGNCPQTDGGPPSAHTYHSLGFIPPSVAGNAKGAFVHFHSSVHVADLDTGLYDVPFYAPPFPTDLSYKNVIFDGWKAYFWRGNEVIRPYDLSPTARTATLWSDSIYNVADANGYSSLVDPARIGQQSRGVILPTINPGSYLHYSKKASAHMPTERTLLILAATASGYIRRVRYGEAIDAGATNWGAYCDSPTLTSSDDSHLDFTAGNFDDAGGGQPLYEAGCCFDPVTRDLFIIPNNAGASVLKLTGAVDQPVLQVQRLTGHATLNASPNGTFQRCMLIRKGTARLLVRVTSTTRYPEICRLQED